MAPFEPAALPELLPVFYRRLFPHAAYGRWLSYGGVLRQPPGAGAGAAENQPLQDRHRGCVLAPPQPAQHGAPGRLPAAGEGAGVRHRHDGLRRRAHVLQLRRDLPQVLAPDDHRHPCPRPGARGGPGREAPALGVLGPPGCPLLGVRRRGAQVVAGAARGRRGVPVAGEGRRGDGEEGDAVGARAPLRQALRERRGALLRCLRPGGPGHPGQPRELGEGAGPRAGGAPRAAAGRVPQEEGLGAALGAAEGPDGADAAPRGRREEPAVPRRLGDHAAVLLPPAGHQRQQRRGAPAEEPLQRPPQNRARFGAAGFAEAGALRPLCRPHHQLPVPGAGCSRRAGGWRRG
ncbi:DNA primase small subunit isoform X2 [Rhea pennata]|uniref:DNA primase small subunit isoform X2 n=1 Tax=Rhea pennata TaxID=8795 RepID=UPI002E264D9A